jgi:hypothetical protein
MKWVNVKDRLPDANDQTTISKSGRVLVRWPNGEVYHTAEVHRESLINLGDQTEWLERAFAKCNDQPSTVIINPTHYMPPIWWHMLVAGACGGMLARMVVDLLTAVIGWGVK